MRRKDVYELSDTPVGLHKERTPAEKARDTKVVLRAIQNYKASQAVTGVHRGKATVARKNAPKTAVSIQRPVGKKK